MQGRGRMTALQVKCKMFSFHGTSPVTIEGLLAVIIHLGDWIWPEFYHWVYIYFDIVTRNPDCNIEHPLRIIQKWFKCNFILLKVFFFFSRTWLRNFFPRKPLVWTSRNTGRSIYMNIPIFRVFVKNVRFTSSQVHKLVFTKWLFTPRNTLYYVAVWSDYPVVGIILRGIKDSSLRSVARFVKPEWKHI